MHVHAWMRQIFFTRRVDTANRTSSKLSQFFNSMINVNLHVSPYVYTNIIDRDSATLLAPSLRRVIRRKTPRRRWCTSTCRLKGRRPCLGRTAWLPDSGTLQARGTMRWMERLCMSTDFSFCTCEMRKDQKQDVRLRRAAERSEPLSEPSSEPHGPDTSY